MNYSNGLTREFLFQFFVKLQEVLVGINIQIDMQILIIMALITQS